MKNMILVIGVFFGVSVCAQQKTMIGRCSFDPQMVDLDKGDFRAGNAVANFYRVTDASGQKKVIVAHGISKVNGFIIEFTDLVDGKRVDQGENWHIYDVAFLNPGVPFQAWWIDDEALAVNPMDPEKSIIGYDYPKLGEVRSVPASGSFLQNEIVRVPNAYPTCIFWESPQE